MKELWEELRGACHARDWMAVGELLDEWPEREFGAACMYAARYGWRKDAIEGKHIPIVGVYRVEFEGLPGSCSDMYVESFDGGVLQMVFWRCTNEDCTIKLAKTIDGDEVKVNVEVRGAPAVRSFARYHSETQIERFAVWLACVLFANVFEECRADDFPGTCPVDVRIHPFGWSSSSFEPHPRVIPYTPDVFRRNWGDPGDDDPGFDRSSRGVSVGYHVEFDETPGVHPEHGPYDAIQTRRDFQISVSREGEEQHRIRIGEDSRDDMVDALVFAMNAHEDLEARRMGDSVQVSGHLFRNITYITAPSVGYHPEVSEQERARRSGLERLERGRKGRRRRE